MDPYPSAEGQVGPPDLSRFATRRTRCRASRLPTPETSRSSFESNECAMPSTIRNDSALATSTRSRVDTEFVRAEFLYPKPKSEMYPFREPVPFSPPYDASDVRRPSLPPLKLVLGDSMNMASPPRTPRIASIPSQPMPREPMYTADTYRPPSLYPNKKQRIEALEPVLPPSTTSSSFTSRPSTAFEPSPRGVSTRPTPPHIDHSPFIRSRSSKAPAHLRTEHLQKSHDRVQAPPSMRVPNAPIEFMSSQPYERVQQTSHSTPTQSSWNDAVPSSSFGAQMFSTQESSPNRAAFQLPHAADESYSETHGQLLDRHYSPPAYDLFGRGDQGSSFDRFERRRSGIHTDISSSRYPHDQSTDALVSGSYGYYYPKARKRSNLPKHSTEIMRAWFDQNIGNPYPSEDQKALFAAATGISLTQVSNWFINHRRRCPELRDKRAERRKP